jgi:arylsulfatase
MISHLDDHVGAVLHALDDLGLADNTLVIFTSDNGTTHPAKNPAFHVGGVDASFFNSTGGLRGWKGSLYEGGLRVPTIVRWPGRIRPGSVTDFPSYFADWFPTLCHIAGAGIQDTPRIDGIDLGPLLSEKGSPARKRPMIWEFHGYGGNLAVIDGPWKAIRQKVMTKQPGEWELYRLDKDPSESEDLAKHHPEVLAKLIAASENDRSAEPDFPFHMYDAKRKSEKPTEK